MKNNLSTFDWIKFAIATAIAGATMAVTVVAWSYTTFVSKDLFELILQRLDRIENKIDSMRSN